MMLLLIAHVILHVRTRRGANGEGSVTFLPSKLGFEILLLHPRRTGFLQLAHEVGEGMRGLQTHEKMNVVLNAANSFRNASEPAHGSSEILVHAITPRRGDLP